MIKTLHLKNFAAFKDLRIDLSPRINILLGENGTGKTQLLKAAYGAAHAVGMHQRPPQNGGAPVERHITDKLLRIFSPVSEGLQELRHTGGGNGASVVSAVFENSTSFDVAFQASSDMVAVNAKGELESVDLRPVFIPSKEVLSFVKGILHKEHDSRTVELIFDDGALDLVRALQQPDVHEKVAAAMTQMQEAETALAKMDKSAKNIQQMLKEGAVIMGQLPNNYQFPADVSKMSGTLPMHSSPDELLMFVRTERVRYENRHQRFSAMQNEAKAGHALLEEAERFPGVSQQKRSGWRRMSQLIDDMLGEMGSSLRAQEEFLNTVEEAAHKMAARDLDPRYNAMVAALVNLVGGTYKWEKDAFSFQCGVYEGASADSLEVLSSGAGDYTPAKFKPGAVSPYGIAMIAEGFRKIGMLHRLISNETLSPDSGALLLWDEPEANLNPKLMEILVQVLLALARGGHQIVLATHDDALLSWFDLFTRKSDEEMVRYHALYRDGASGQLVVNSTDEYLEIDPNAIDAVWERIADREIRESMGNMGK